MKYRSQYREWRRRAECRVAGVPRRFNGQLLATFRLVLCVSSAQQTQHWSRGREGRLQGGMLSAVNIVRLPVSAERNSKLGIIIPANARDKTALDDRKLYGVWSTRRIQEASRRMGDGSGQIKAEWQQGA